MFKTLLSCLFGFSDDAHHFVRSSDLASEHCVLKVCFRSMNKSKIKLLMETWYLYDKTHARVLDFSFFSPFARQHASRSVSRGRNHFCDKTCEVERVYIYIQCSYRVLLKSTCAFLCFFFDQLLFYVLFCAFFLAKCFFFLIFGK